MMKLLAPYRKLQNDTRYTLVSGGRGSGKSTQVAAFIITLTFNQDETILYTRYTMRTAKDSVIPAVLNAAAAMGCEEAFRVESDRITNIYTGSKIIFSGIKTSSGNQTAKLKGIEGLTCWVLDEAEEMVNPREFHDIDDSIRKKGGSNKVILVLNSNNVDLEHWLYKEFFAALRPNSTYIHTTYLDNLHNLAQSFIDTANYYKVHDPAFYKINYLGEFPTLEGKIFSKGYETYTIEPEEYDWFAVGGDWGFADHPTAAIAIWKNGMRLYLKELIYAPGLTNQQIAEKIKAAGHHAAMSIWDSAEKKSIMELRMAGINALPAQKGPGTVSLGIKKLQDFSIFIHEESTNLQNEWRRYRWAKRANGDFARNEKGHRVPVKEGDDGIDAVRYGVTKLIGWG